MLTAALHVTALLFGGMMLYSFGFAAFLFTALPADMAGATIRRAFPHFYLFVIGCAGLAAGLTWPFDPVGATLLALVAVHVAAVLAHQFVWKTDLIARMK